MSAVLIWYTIFDMSGAQDANCAASHAVNWPAAALGVKQMLEWQCDCHSCCCFRSVAVVLSSSSSCSHQCLFTVFMPEGWCSGASLWDRSCHSIAPASRSLRRAWDNGRVAGGVRHCLSVIVGQKQREGRVQWKEEAVRLRFLVFGLRGESQYHAGHLCRAYGTGLRWIHRESTGIHAHFSVLTPRTTLWILTVIVWQPVVPSFSPSACVKHCSPLPYRMNEKYCQGV